MANNCRIKGKVKVTSFKGNTDVATWKKTPKTWNVGVFHNCSLVGEPYKLKTLKSANKKHRSIVRKMKEWKEPL